MYTPRYAPIWGMLRTPEWISSCWTHAWYGPNEPGERDEGMDCKLPKPVYVVFCISMGAAPAGNLRYTTRLGLCEQMSTHQQESTAPIHESTIRGVGLS